MNKHSEYNTTMADADASSAAITASACPTCGQRMPQDFTNTQTMMAQANQRRVSFAGTAAPANQPAPIWSSWDPTFPVQHILQVDHMLETGSAYRQPPERHEADIAQFQMDIDAIHAPNMPTDFAIDPQLLDANSMAFVPVQTTAEWVQSSIPPAVSLQHISYPAVAPQINPVGYFGAMEQHTVTNTDVADVYTRGIRELGPTRREQIQQSHNAPTSEPDHHGTTIYKCQECGVEFARRDGLR
jgi:DNA-directed RNA polymerase subunit RPC12/RpoP